MSGTQLIAIGLVIWRRAYLVAEAGSEERDGAGRGRDAVADWRIAGGRGV